jgi:hypothetical protein
VGTAGSTPERCVPMIASGLILPALRCGIAVPVSTKAMSSVPPSKSLTSGAAPL